MGDGEQLIIEVRREQDRVIVALRGELDLASANLLQNELESGQIETAPMLVLDLQRLKFIDSTGLRVVLAAHEQARERGQEFAITRGSQQVQRLLSITGVAEHMRVIASADEMLV